MTVGKSLVEDMARAMALRHSEEAVQAYDAGSCAVGYWDDKAEAALQAVKDRLPADDRELVDELRAIVAECSNPECYVCEVITPAADRITAYSASRDEVA